MNKRPIIILYHVTLLARPQPPTRRSRFNAWALTFVSTENLHLALQFNSLKIMQASTPSKALCLIIKGKK